ncbi:MAG: hypothetical protein J1G02_02715 [Clostridiales bacterium]|nr:hypothetical protein [Clostridiales bacterium]
MINVLLNYYNFDGDWARPHLNRIFAPKPRVLILPLAYRETQAWDNDSFLSIYGKGGEKYDNILRPFLSYGYDEKDIAWLNPYDGGNHLALIRNADMLFFTGGMPEKAIARMRQLGIVDAVKSFNGTVMGASAGAMLQLETYHITPDEDYDSYGIWQGLALVKGLDLEVHYLATDVQKQCTARAVKQLALPVYQMWHEGGLLIEDGKVTVMGNVEVVK